MRIVQSIGCFLAVMLPACTVLAESASPFSGKFTDGKVTADWTESGGTFTGTIALGDQKFDSTAHAKGDAIEGSFVAGGNTFPFTGTLNGQTLTFVTGTATYTLQKQSTALNPLVAAQQAQPANPLAPAQSSGVLPAGYTVVSKTDAGQVLSAQKPGTKTILAALQATMPEMAKYFDGKPAVVREFEDTVTQQTGGVSFTANLKGQAVNGVVTCKLSEKGAAVSVLYCNANANAADWNKLMASSAGGTSAPAPVQLHEYQFPDNTGTIGLADGWTTKATTCNGTVIITGPNEQAITLGFYASAVTPNSTAVQINQQLNANARQMGGQPIPLGLCVAPFTDPISVFKTLMPQLSSLSQQNGGPSLVVDHVGKGKSINSILENGRAAVFMYGLTLGTNGEQKHQQVLAQVEIDPVSNDSFMFGLSACAAPDATFQKDMPVMLAMMQSLHENGAVIAEQTRENIDAMNRRFATQQQAQKELLATYDDYNKSMEHNSLVQSRSNADFDEVIRGDRTIQDTETGEKTSVNLGDSDKIVDNLNYYQPGRFKQIPLRDELYPLPNGQQ